MQKNKASEFADRFMETISKKTLKEHVSEGNEWVHDLAQDMLTKPKDPHIEELIEELRSFLLEE